ncbi:conserved hypothetical protein [Tenacibaculum sp. 190524A05c]|uniref:hypothetical protein n=1 Tax=Tenacibaculum platacis TaxID=3137852 RepID=UPI0031FB118A
MNYPLRLLKNKLKELENAQEWCLENGNLEDFQKIEETKSKPIRLSISLIEMAVENELKFKVILE